MEVELDMEVEVDMEVVVEVEWTIQVDFVRIMSNCPIVLVSIWSI